jgi:GH35 family endo-1,4-beta-xylanase
VTVWGISKAYTWIDTVLNYPDGMPLHFDSNFAPKPAYFSMRDVLQGR